MKEYNFNCGESSSCDCSIYEKNKEKKIPYGKIVKYIVYGLAFGVFLNTICGQCSQNKEKKEVKTEQVGKSIDSFLNDF